MQHDDDDTIAISMQLVVLSQVKYKMNRPFDTVQLVVLHQDVYNDPYGYSATTIDGELILLLFWLAYQVDRMYQFTSQSKYQVVTKEDSSTNKTKAAQMNRFNYSNDQGRADNH